VAAGGSHEKMMEIASEEAQKNERIAGGTQRTTFMNLGERQVNLTSDSKSQLLQRQKPSSQRSTASGSQGGRPEAYQTDAQRKTQVYINDESVPAQIYPLIEDYRAKILELSNGREHAALIIDDFFGEAHSILKDTHLKEIARIRNEQNVEIMKLKKSLENRLLKEGVARGSAIGSFDRAKDNQAAFAVKDVFADNEAERQRRLLTEENELLKKRVRAIETIA